MQIIYLPKPVNLQQQNSTRNTLPQAQSDL